MELSAEGTARLFLENVFRRFGYPKKITSDRGPQFVSNFMTVFYKMLNVHANPSTAYHPQTDGLTERANGEVIKYLRMWVNARQTDWADWLPIAEFSINNRISDVSKVSPFFLNHGRHPRTDVTLTRDTANPAANAFAKTMKEAWEDAQSAIKMANEVMTTQANKHRKDARPYKIGDEVLLEAVNLKIKKGPGAVKKFQSKRVGPYTIIKKVGRSAYKLRLPPKWKIHPTINESLLMPYVKPDTGIGPSTRPPPDDIEGEEEYKVEGIIDSRLHGRHKTLQYLVKWQGYGQEENSWEPAPSVKNAAEEVEEFHRRHPEKPGPVTPRPPRQTVAQGKKKAAPAPEAPRRSARHNRSVVSDFYAAEGSNPTGWIESMDDSAESDGGV